MSSSFKRMIPGLMVLALLAASLSACTASAEQNPTPVLDERVFGHWSNADGRPAVSVNAKGEPVGDVAIGIWFTFNPDGTYYQVANHMTFAIGGIAVEEGRYAVDGNQLVLTRRTWSFFPFEGSPQKKQYRTEQPDGKLGFAFGEEKGVRTLILGEAGDSAVVFYPVK